MFYDKLKKVFENRIVFLDNADRKSLMSDETGEKVLFLEGCWEAITKDEIDKINSYKKYFMNMHPDDNYRTPLRPLIEFNNYIDFSQRDIDVFFCGESTKSFNWVNNNSMVVCEPSTWSRMSMVIQSFMIKNKNVVMLPQEQWGGKISREKYASMLARTKIALCPVGSTWESYRIAEAALNGCVIITTPFDKTLFPYGPYGDQGKIPWYFEEHPFIFVDRDWKTLSHVIEQLDEEKLSKYHKKTLEWANKYMSEEAMIKFVESKI